MIIYNNLNYVFESRLDDNQYYIYVIENDAKNVKVGISRDFSQRLLSLSGSNNGGNIPIRCAVSSPTYLRTLEPIIHRQFEQYRVPGTEWFKNVAFEDVVDYIDSLFNSRQYKICNEERRKVGGYFGKGKSVYSKKSEQYKTDEDD